ncbi:MAG: DUF421 domain-containing protein [Ruminococcaceae bacterium]|nr:DUF421 domain-containing protein [Oscillospiraceae bacterium]MBR3597250.1 DUF421 domain-containing protein [Clostridia bacterium]
MLISFVRTGILLVVIVFAVRIMGKRQIGQLQPAELVVTILLSEMAATPMQDNDIPMLNTLVAIFTLIGLEITVSFISMKSVRIRNLLQGNSLILIRNGVLDQKQLRRLRFTLDDLLEALRNKDVFDISDVKYAIAETDGTLSVMLNDNKRTISPEDMGISPPDKGLSCVVVMDGVIIRSDFKDCGMDDKKLSAIIKKTGIPLKDIFLLTVNKNGDTNVIRKEK